MSAEPLPLLAPELPLPPYAYVPGGPHPHPTGDPRGHSFGQTLEHVVIDPEHWAECRPYLHGFDLFNHGYFWEAHEAWEALWHGCGRQGTTADFLKGLIKLAAAGVKQREGMPAGVAGHVGRARELFALVATQTGRLDYLGLNLEELGRRADVTAPLVPEQR